MLEKIVTIQNVGKFHDCHAAGDVTFRKLTLIYAENSRGKTTLCDLLRSLQTGRPETVLGRRTLTATEQPNAILRKSGQTATFKGNAWNTTVPQLAIYDSTFVHNNVYAGDYVDHEHKKSLYHVIVGEQGVQLANQVHNLDNKIRNANREISTTKQSLTAVLPKGLSLGKFLALPKVEDVDTRIQEKKAEVTTLSAASSRSQELAQKPLLTKTALPAFPTGFAELLAKELADVSKDAESQIRTHLQSSTNTASEAWLSQGLDYLRGDTCPFCSQSVTGVQLLVAYRTYFGRSYRGVKGEIASMKASAAGIAAQCALLHLQRTIVDNTSLCDFWKQFVSFDAPSIDFSQLHTPLQNLSSAATTLLEEKLKSPLEPLVVTDDFSTATAAYEAAKSTVESYNAAIDKANKLIAAKKAEPQAGNLMAAQAQLAALEAAKRRHDQPVDEVCKAYQKAVYAKATLEQKKEDAKAKLDNYTSKIFTQHQARINHLLEIFNAGFRIIDTRRQYLGGTPSSTYQLLIDDVSIPLGDAATPADTSSFKNTLSAGDRSTLALAFFLAYLDDDPNLSQKIVIFDDPFTSQDQSRRTCTQQQLCKLAQKADQVVVLSHSPAFLRLVWDAVPAAQAKTLQLTRMGKNTVVTEWDIQDETCGGYFQNYAVLKNYRDDGSGESRHAAQTIRPVLEGYFRFKLPGQFAETEWLGDFIQRIRNADPSTPLHPAKVILDELQDLNDYSKKYHHNTNPLADSEPINDGEREGFVKRTFDLVGGF